MKCYKPAGCVRLAGHPSFCTTVEKVARAEDERSIESLLAEIVEHDGGSSVGRARGREFESLSPSLSGETM